MGARNVQEFYSKISLVYFIAATTVLMALAFFLLGTALREMWQITKGADAASTALSSISLLIIGFAVIETAKFIAEEEVLRSRELRSTRESRRSITKFITIIVIAASLEALVMVFQATREGIEFAIYPAALFLAATISLVSLGVYQWLSSRIGDHHDQD
ncbi:GNAT family acetyltransferase [Hoeflea sp. WL0058]|uniref:GNAT family acetyltransferase n=1 Tax=Flavimaribacter sediminis TaxID=2865987 RepID=A0AAE3CZY4_9HYPH|nr:GNAT family acetyltransferase [Flavimaribacter sediminis]